jgi:hypothetical protein
LAPPPLRFKKKQQRATTTANLPILKKNILDYSGFCNFVFYDNRYYIMEIIIYEKF